AVSPEVAAAPPDPLEAALARAAAHAGAAPTTAVPAASEPGRALAVLRDETRAASAVQLLDRSREQTMPVGETVEHFKLQPLDQKSVAKVIHGNVTALQHCHARLTARGKRCDGDTSLRFTIDPRGKVTSVVVHASGADSAALEACIAASVKTWKFPAAAAPTDVDFPLVFDTAR
ncbi:MAG TPA: AgmX/PglI C-terminal domain-containing protein, partial [Kofleriaceae bacterium]|nr:AgmX/PglI C-terminal domain-containing protein [Kofleriaceae bacterium]